MKTKNIRNCECKNGTIKERFTPEVMFLMFESEKTNKYHGCRWTGKKQWHLINRNLNMENILIECNMNFKRGNDAIRGGQEGNYIEIDKRQLTYLRKYLTNNYTLTGKYNNQITRI